MLRRLRYLLYRLSGAEARDQAFWDAEVAERYYHDHAAEGPFGLGTD